jgi:hypothetical protein
MGCTLTCESVELGHHTLMQNALHHDASIPRMVKHDVASRLHASEILADDVAVSSKPGIRSSRFASILQLKQVPCRPSLGPLANLVCGNSIKIGLRRSRVAKSHRPRTRARNPALRRTLLDTSSDAIPLAVPASINSWSNWRSLPTVREPILLTASSNHQTRRRKWHTARR